MMDLALLEAIRRYQATYGYIRTATQTRLAGLWDRFGGVGDANAEAFVAAAVPVIEGAQVAVGSLVSSYVATLVRLTGSSPTAAPPVDLAVSALRGGVPAAEVYTRPIITTRAALARGATLLEALAAGSARVDALAASDVMLAQRSAMTQIARAEKRIVAYRRVLTGRSCAFCGAASTQRYHSGDLMPIHAYCDCSVAPIFANSDPGQIINQPLLDDLKAAAGRVGAPDYARARHLTVDEKGVVRFPEVAIRQHGELGPVLVSADHRFTTAASIAA